MKLFQNIGNVFLSMHLSKLKQFLMYNNRSISNRGWALLVSDYIGHQTITKALKMQTPLNIYVSTYITSSKLLFPNKTVQRVSPIALKETLILLFVCLSFLLFFHIIYVTCFLIHIRSKRYNISFLNANVRKKMHPFPKSSFITSIWFYWILLHIRKIDTSA